MMTGSARVSRLLIVAVSAGCADPPTAASPAFQSGAPGTVAGAPGAVVLAGGGSEGNQGNTQSWSYRLYREFILNGDTDGDGVIRVAIVATTPQSSFLTGYFHWIGTTLGDSVVATDYTVPDLATANNPAVVGPVGGADVLFIKGGDQGVYYDQWNGTFLETRMQAIATRGGAVGGTSAGAMSMAGFCTTRGRMGCLLGIMARATEDNADDSILAIGLDERTGVAIQGGVARVIGTGEVAFVHQTPATLRLRDAGRPLVYTELAMDRLTEGWQYDLAARAPIGSAPPPGAAPVSYPGPGAGNSGALSIGGGADADKTKFQWVAAYQPADYGLSRTAAATYVRDAVGIMNGGNSSSRGSRQETLFRALYDRPAAVGVLGFAGGTLTRTALGADLLAFGGTIATIVVDAQRTDFKGLSPAPSNVAVRGGTLKAAALTALRIHVLAESSSRGVRFDTRLHALVP